MTSEAEQPPLPLLPLFFLSSSSSLSSICHQLVLLFSLFVDVTVDVCLIPQGLFLYSFSE